MKPKVYSICATAGRHQLLERSVACFLAQDYEGEHTLLIYNNSEIALRLDLDNIPNWEFTLDGAISAEALIGNKRIKLINQNLDSLTGEEYINLGAIYRDALKWVPEDIDIITFQDDDDLFLPNHISEGVKGFLKGKKTAYKPQFSWFRHTLGMELMNNTLEPSFFINAKFLKDTGFGEETTSQHLKWVHKLLAMDGLFVDQEGVPTLIYNWGDTNIPTFKTSGNAGDPNNFQNYRVFSQDHGDKVITPLNREDLEQYYQQVYTEEAYKNLRSV